MPFVEVAESVGWCSHGRGSRAKSVVVDVEDVTVEPQAQGGAELVMGAVVSK